VSLFESAEPSYPAIARAVEAWADANDHDKLRAGEAVIAETEWAAADQVLDAIADEGLAAVTDVLEDADRTDEEAADTTAEAITLAVPPAMTSSSRCPAACCQELYRAPLLAVRPTDRPWPATVLEVLNRIRSHAPGDPAAARRRHGRGDRGLDSTGGRAGRGVRARCS
jgi:hypothetical protein